MMKIQVTIATRQYIEMRRWRADIIAAVHLWMPNSRTQIRELHMLRQRDVRSVENVMAIGSTAEITSFVA